MSKMLQVVVVLLTLATGSSFANILKDPAFEVWPADKEVYVFREVPGSENGKMGGPIVYEDRTDSTFASSGSWSRISRKFRPALEAANGKKLFFSFFGVDPQKAGTTGFARVDNIDLTAQSP